MPSKTFRDFYLNDLGSAAEREEYAKQAGTTFGFLNRLAYSDKAVDLGFADALVAVSKGRLTLDNVQLTERAERQRRIREANRRSGKDRRTEERVKAA